MPALSQVLVWMNCKLVRRVLESELIDQLPADDPSAVASRRDMLRLNRLMGHPGAMRKALREAYRAGARTLADVGAGDGRFLLLLARQLANEGMRFNGLLLDARQSIKHTVLEEFQKAGWSMRTVFCEAKDWLEGTRPGEIDVITTTLCLHHLDSDELKRLFELAAGRVNFLIACEPRRSRSALAAARCVGLIGCNAVTRHDSLASVKAGFSRNELTERWPRSIAWQLEERRLGIFSHLFVARRQVH